MSCGVGHRYGLDLALPWLWHSLAALAPIRPLAWEPPHARGVALKKKKKKKKKKLFLCNLFRNFFFFFFKCPHPQLMGVPGPGTDS